MVEHPPRPGAKVSLRAVMYGREGKVSQGAEKAKVEAVVAEHLGGPRCGLAAEEGYRRRRTPPGADEARGDRRRLLTRKPAAKAEVKQAEKGRGEARRREAGREGRGGAEAKAERSRRRWQAARGQEAGEGSRRKKPAPKKPAARKTTARRSSSAKKET